MSISEDLNNLYNEFDALRVMLSEVSDALAEMIRCRGGGDATTEILMQYQQAFNDKIKAVRDLIQQKQQLQQQMMEQVMNSNPGPTSTMYDMMEDDPNMMGSAGEGTKSKNHKAEN